MANSNVYKALKKGKRIFFETNCKFCNTTIIVKKRNQKFCDNICKQLDFVRRETEIKAGKQKRINLLNENQIILSNQIKEAAKSKKYELAEDLQKRKDEILLTIKELS